MAVNRTSGRTPSRKLAFINAGLYLGCVAVGGLVVASSARALLLFYREPVTYLPGLPRDFWLVGLELLLALLGALALGRALAGERPSFALSAGVWGLMSALLAYWMVGNPGAREISALHPRAEVVGHLNTLAVLLKDRYRQEGRYPESLEVLAGRTGFPEGPTPWTGRGRRLTYQHVSERGLGARLAGRDGDLAGTFYYVVSPTRDHYWLTAVILDGAPTGNLAFLRDTSGHPMIISSRSSSKVDETQPIFPGGR
ncbi:MAG: hypothetical protein P1V51_05660 [Deltaproteobacteria bacterium]|nr:hypothetical protein [Deltaproteobacteria bacterium]